MKVHAGIRLEPADWAECEKRVNNYEEMLEMLEKNYWTMYQEYPHDQIQDLHDLVAKLKGVEKLESGWGK